MVISFGIYKGRKVRSMCSVVETQYLYWLYGSQFGGAGLKEEISNFLRI